MNTTYFTGYDWTELARAWNIYIPNSYAGKDMYECAEKHRLNPGMDKGLKYIRINDDGTEEEKTWDGVFNELDWSVNDYENFDETDPILWYITCALKKYDGGNETRVMKKIANDIREFCRALAKDSFTYLGPLWIGLSEIENDWTLINMVTMKGPLLQAMWD